MGAKPSKRHTGYKGGTFYLKDPVPAKVKGRKPKLKLGFGLLKSKGRKSEKTEPLAVCSKTHRITASDRGNHQIRGYDVDSQYDPTPDDPSVRIKDSNLSPTTKETPVPTPPPPQPQQYRLQPAKPKPLIVNGQRFYRPGEPGHPAYRPTSAEFMYRHGMGQNAIVKRKRTAEEPVTSTKSLSSPLSDNTLDERDEDKINADKVPLDNILDADTYDAMFGRKIDDESDRETQGGDGSWKRPMKFYRPGDPNHQAVRPITSAFKRKYMAQEELARMQNEMIQYD